jgi:hypothetical protein
MSEKKNTPGMRETGIVLTGKVKFNNISEAKSFTMKDGTVTKPKYDLTLVFEQDSENVAIIEALHKKAVAHEMAAIPKAKQRSTGTRPVALMEDTDKEGNETGLLRIKLTRGEKQGQPRLVDTAGKPIERTFIRSGSDVRVQVTATSYNVAGSVGLSLIMEGIQLVREEEGTGTYTPKQVDLVFTAEDMEKSPF